MAAAADGASISSASIPYPSPPPPPPPPLPAQTASSQSPIVPVPSPASSLHPRVLSSAPARARVRRAEADSDGEVEGDWDGDVGAGGLVGEVPTAAPSTSPSTRSTSSPPTPSFLFGNSMPSSALARITENTKSSDGVVVISMANAPLGFGVAARGAQDGRKADTDTVVMLHQSDAGEYLRKEEELM